MIRFPCTCKQHLFEVDDDDAGRQLQCPRCGRLNDVPTLSDLASISEDGTYRLDATIDRHEAEQERLAQLQRAFARTRVDEWGREIDLRPTMDDVMAANSAPAAGPDGAVRTGAPKYDPVTGELVRAIELNTDPRLSQPPIPVAKRAIHYAAAEASNRQSIYSIFLQLFTAPNVTVMTFIFITHLIIQMMAVAVAMGMFLVVPVAFAVVCSLIAHYANTIDETGPDQRDELPRPLRGMSWHDDLWGSFVNFTTAVAVSYGPGFAVLWTPLPELAQIMILAAGAVFGTIVFPAALLTSTTSGTWMNLRPDRMLGVIRSIGPVYIFAIILWIMTAVIYVAGFIATSMTILSFMGAGFFGPWAILSHWAVSYPLLLVGIYLMHAYCWMLGLQYRKHHDAFPWVLQRYVKGPKSPPPAQGGRHGFSVLPQTAPAKVAGPVPVPAIAQRPTPALPVALTDEELKRAQLEQRRARMLQQNREMNLVPPPQSVLPIEDDLSPPRQTDERRGFPLD
jgi:hypothetical protein